MREFGSFEGHRIRSAVQRAGGISDKGPLDRRMCGCPGQRIQSGVFQTPGYFGWPASYRQSAWALLVRHPHTIATERQQLDQHREALEAERRHVAEQQQRAPVIAAAITQGGLIVACLAPLALEAVRRRFERWRRTRSVRSAIPEPLWDSAVKMAGS